MSEIEISTKGLIRELKAKIDGHVYTVRKLGAGTQLDIQRKTTKMSTISKKAFNLKSRFEAAKKTKGGDTKETLAMVDELDKLMVEMNDTQESLARSWMKLFDDGTDDQRFTKELLEKYGTAGLQKLNARAFGSGDEAEEESDD